MTDLNVSSVAMIPADDRDVATGLIGWITLVIDNALLVDGITLRRTRDGRYCLSYPSRRDRSGHQRFYLRPTGNHARCDLERQVFARLNIEQEATP